MFLPVEEGCEGECAVEVGDVQVMPFIGKPRAEEGEVGRVTPQSAAGAVLGLRGVQGSKLGRVRAGEGMVHGQLEGCGGSAS